MGVSRLFVISIRRVALLFFFPFSPFSPQQRYVQKMNGGWRVAGLGYLMVDGDHDLWMSTFLFLNSCLVHE